jgi:hypothetical protein
MRFHGPRRVTRLYGRQEESIQNPVDIRMLGNIRLSGSRKAVGGAAFASLLFFSCVFQAMLLPVLAASVTVRA